MLGEWGARAAGSNVVISIEGDRPLIAALNPVGTSVAKPHKLGGGMHVVKAVSPGPCPLHSAHQAKTFVLESTDYVFAECDRCKKFHWYKHGS